MKRGVGLRNIRKRGIRIREEQKKREREEERNINFEEHIASTKCHHYNIA